MIQRSRSASSRTHPKIEDIFYEPDINARLVLTSSIYDLVSDECPSIWRRPLSLFTTGPCLISPSSYCSCLSRCLAGIYPDALVMLRFAGAPYTFIWHHPSMPLKYDSLDGYDRSYQYDIPRTEERRENMIEEKRREERRESRSAELHIWWWTVMVSALTCFDLTWLERKGWWMRGSDGRDEGITGMTWDEPINKITRMGWDWCWCWCWCWQLWQIGGGGVGKRELPYSSSFI